MTPSGIEPATFQFVGQSLNHCATAAPTKISFFDTAYLYRNVGLFFHFRMCVCVRACFGVGGTWNYNMQQYNIYLTAIGL